MDNGKSKYTEREFNDFKKRLGLALVNDALDSNAALANADLKSQMMKIVETEIINKKESYAIQGIVHNLTLVDINVSNRETRTFPVINQYQGHDLTKTLYLHDNGNNQIVLKEVCVRTSPIIIP